MTEAQELALRNAIFRALRDHMLRQTFVASEVAEEYAYQATDEVISRIIQEGII